MQEMPLHFNFYDASQGKFIVKSFYALLEQELLLVEEEGRHILAESVRDRISEQGKKLAETWEIIKIYPTSTPQVPHMNPTSAQ